MIITVDENGTEVSTKINGVQRSKRVNIADLLAGLSQYSKSDFGLFPPNTRIFETFGNHVLIGVEFEAKTRQIKHIDETFQCNVPGGIAMFILDRDSRGGYRILNSHLFALRGRLTFPTDLLYMMPFPNIYRDYGKICWGEVVFRDSMKGLLWTEGAMASFWNNGFNNDLWNRGEALSENYTADKAYCTEYFHHISENDFNPDWLRPTGLTVDGFKNHIIGGEI